MKYIKLFLMEGRGKILNNPVVFSDMFLWIIVKNFIKNNWKVMKELYHSKRSKPWIDKLQINFSFIICLKNVWIPLKLEIFVKYHSEGWTSELEVSHLLSLFDIISLWYSWLAARYLSHSYFYHCNTSSWAIINLNDHDLSNWNHAEHWLRFHITLAMMVYSLGEVILVNKEVRTSCFVGLDHFSWYWSMPTVIAPRI